MKRCYAITFFKNTLESGIPFTCIPYKIISLWSDTLLYPILVVIIVASNQFSSFSLKGTQYALLVTDLFWLIVACSATSLNQLSQLHIRTIKVIWNAPSYIGILSGALFDTVYCAPFAMPTIFSEMLLSLCGNSIEMLRDEGECQDITHACWSLLEVLVKYPYWIRWAPSLF